MGKATTVRHSLALSRKTLSHSAGQLSTPFQQCWGQQRGATCSQWLQPLQGMEQLQLRRVTLSLRDCSCHQGAYTLRPHAISTPYITLDTHHYQRNSHGGGGSSSSNDSPVPALQGAAALGPFLEPQPLGQRRESPCCPTHAFGRLNSCQSPAFREAIS